MGYNDALIADILNPEEEGAVYYLPKKKYINIYAKQQGFINVIK